MMYAYTVSFIEGMDKKKALQRELEARAAEGWEPHLGWAGGLGAVHILIFRRPTTKD